MTDKPAITEDYILHLNSELARCEKLVFSIALEVDKMRGTIIDRHRYYFDSYHISDNDTVAVTIGWGTAGDFSVIKFPSLYLETDNWELLEQKAIDDGNRLAKIVAEQERKTKEAKVEAEERKTLQALTAKYGPI